MIWQDIVMMIGGFGFSIALLPSIFSSKKPAKTSCLITAIIMAAYVVAMATLGLLLSTIANGITASLWWVLLIQQK